MGLFDKKYCDICGEKIGLLGNRKLEDGNLCKNCAAKLSPFFSERRRSTVEDIKRQLAYREENEKLVRDFNPDVMFDGSKKCISAPSPRRLSLREARIGAAPIPISLSFRRLLRSIQI